MSAGLLAFGVFALGFGGAAQSRRDGDSRLAEALRRVAEARSVGIDRLAIAWALVNGPAARRPGDARGRERLDAVLRALEVEEADLRAIEEAAAVADRIRGKGAGSLRPLP